MNTITIELCAEDRARLDKILEALTRRPDCTKCAQGVVDYVTAVTGIDEYGVKVEPEVEVTAPAETLPPPISVAEVQQKVVALSAAGKKAEVRDIVKAYADKVSAIPEEKLGEVWLKLCELGG